MSKFKLKKRFKKAEVERKNLVELTQSVSEEELKQKAIKNIEESMSGDFNKEYDFLTTDEDNENGTED